MMLKHYSKDYINDLLKKGNLSVEDEADIFYSLAKNDTHLSFFMSYDDDGIESAVLDRRYVLGDNAPFFKLVDKRYDDDDVLELYEYVFKYDFDDIYVRVTALAPPGYPVSQAFFELVERNEETKVVVTYDRASIVDKS